MHRDLSASGVGFGSSSVLVSESTLAVLRLHSGVLLAVLCLLSASYPLSRESVFRSVSNPRIRRPYFTLLFNFPTPGLSEWKDIGSNLLANLR